MTETSFSYHAACSCGAISVEAAATPKVQVVCACRNCQSRTGSAFGMTVFFPKDAVTTTGAPTVYRRFSEQGRAVDCRFCSVCETTLWWEAEAAPGMIGVAGSLIDGLDFAPDVAVWCQSKPGFVQLPEGLPQFAQGAQAG